MTKLQNFTKGFIKENPIFVFLLGMCPALAVTSTFETSLGMGMLVIFVLTMSNIVISLLRNLIPHDVRTPSYIVVIATFVTIVRMVTEWQAYELYEALGVFIPLIVVNCLILGRAEAFASKNNVLDSAIDGIGMGLGFTFALVVIGITRELLATGAIQLGVYLPFLVAEPMYLIGAASIKDYMLPMFADPSGAFIALGLILAMIQLIGVRKKEKEEIKKQAMIEEKKRIALEKKKQRALLEKEGAKA
jgi:electron transport complex protein RnfE